MANHLILAVAGSRKTQGLIEHCEASPIDRRILVVTLTHANQMEIQTRLRKHAGDRQNIEVLGWYAFLIRHFARPFIPFKFQGKCVRGFDFDGHPHMLAQGCHRYLNSNDWVYGCNLAELSFKLITLSEGTLKHRLECIYDEILIDEVQDLTGYDWEILDVLLQSSLEIRLVGDIRQAVLSTSPRARKNKKYAYAKAITWFRERESSGRLAIEENCLSWRCRPEIAAFSDTIFDSSWSFPATVSKNESKTGHDGIFLVRTSHVYEYVERFRPQCLRWSVSSAKSLKLDFLNFKLAKGLTRKRVLIAPTEGIASFLKTGTTLDPIPAAALYVAVTRAEQSVAFVIDESGQSQIPYWNP